MHSHSQDLLDFSTERTRGIYRVCQCGTSFVSTRRFIRWCSTKCRKQYYSDRRALVAGHWHVMRKTKHETLGSHTRWQWVMKLKADPRCYWCGKYLKRAEAQREHLTPISRGGSDDISNIVPSCKSCNSRKGTKTAEEYAAVLSAEQFSTVSLGASYSGVLGNL